MKIIMKTGISGTRNGEDWPPRGGEIDLPKDEAEQLIEAGHAVLPKDKDQIVEETLVKPETAVPVEPSAPAPAAPEVTTPPEPETPAKPAAKKAPAKKAPAKKSADPKAS